MTGLFLYSPIALGVIFVLIWATSLILVTIPAFSARGKTQLIRLSVAGLFLFAEAGLLITLAVLNSQEKIFQ